MKSVEFEGRTIEYCVCDPTGNITALVVTDVDVELQPAAAAAVMANEPAVEQVGFVRFAVGSNGAQVTLRMAGGEFCGNATMCAAALYLQTNEQAGPLVATVWVDSSGASGATRVDLTKKEGGYDAAVTMPPALSIDEIKFNLEANSQNCDADPVNEKHGAHSDQSTGEKIHKHDIDSGEFFLSLMNMDRLPLVRMEGIDHIIVEKWSPFFNLRNNKSLAESFLKNWCGMIGSECLGLMFLGDESDRRDKCETDTLTESASRNDHGQYGDIEGGVTPTVRQLTPLVYVRGADTIFWENSCASGSAAAGMYLAARAGSSVDVTFDEPAGRLRVESDPLARKTILHGSVSLLLRKNQHQY